MLKKYFSAACMLLLPACFALSMPHLKFSGEGLARLYVDEKPFIILGGELLNSSGSTASDMSEKWDGLKKLNVNTVLVATAWSQIEKQENNFDFSELEDIIEQAEKHDMKIVLLWFGSWKNGMSSYAPHWVMRDTSRFPRMKNKNGENLLVLSNLSDTVLQADKKAFLRLVSFLKEADPKGKTVIMLQVENEIGLLRDSRDRSAAAEKAFLENVPEELISHLKNTKKILPEIAEAWKKNNNKEKGSWAELFSQNNMLADEMFMAWHYAKFVESLIQDGKKIHNIPMFVNAWLIPPDKPVPGNYLSGGPNSRMLDVWQAAAKNLDFLALDNYQKGYRAKLDKFFRNGNPIFVPEACALWRGDNQSGAAKAFYTIGEFGAIGFSPFGIDHPTYSPEHSLGVAYKVLDNLSGEISKAQAKKNMHAFMQEENKSDDMDFGDFKVTARYDYSYKGFGIVIRLSENEFLLAGSGARVSFNSTLPNKSSFYGLVEEGYFEDGKWKLKKYLGGDETFNGDGWISVPPTYLTTDASARMIPIIKLSVYHTDKK